MENLEFVELIIPMGIALLLVLVPFTWKYAISPYVTVIHEYGHAVANLLTFGMPFGIKAHFADGGGVTHSLRQGGFFSGLGTIFSGLSGYPAPILFGIALICSVSGGYAETILLVSAIVFGVFILLMRNFAGFLISIVTAAYFVLAVSLSNYTETFAYFAGSIFLIAGISDLIRLCTYYFKGISDESDLGILKDRFFLPQFFWLILMFAEVVFFGYLLLLTA